MMKIKWKPLIISLSISLGVWVLSGLLTMNNYSIYEKINKPPLSPPGWVFPIVWIILYFLMGISSYLVWTSNYKNKRPAIIAYGLQLIINFLWPIIFFNFELFLLSFFWILLLIVLVVITIVLFKNINSFASWLLVPYLLWIIFACYLNYGIAMYN